MRALLLAGLALLALFAVPLATASGSEFAVDGTAGAGTMFFNSFLILAREGFESILVVGALATYLLRTGHKDKVRLLYSGAAAGVLGTFALYFIVDAAYARLPVDREVLEGITALVAVVALFYVSYWLLSKIEAGSWNRFIQGKMKGALARGGGFALVSVAFLAVFREGFEAVLFYEGLFAAGTGQGAWVIVGILAGAAFLAVTFILFYKYGVKIPMRTFFIATSVLLYYLAFVFAGKGMHALQEGGAVPETAIAGLAGVDLEEVSEWFGFYPTWEVALLQSVLVALVAVGVLYTFVIQPRRGAPQLGAETA